MQTTWASSVKHWAKSMVKKHVCEQCRFCTSSKEKYEEHCKSKPHMLRMRRKSSRFGSMGEMLEGTHVSSMLARTSSMKSVKDCVDLVTQLGDIVRAEKEFDDVDFSSDDD